MLELEGVRSDRRIILHCCSVLAPGAAHGRAGVQPADGGHAEGQEASWLMPRRALVRPTAAPVLTALEATTCAAAVAVRVHAYVRARIKVILLVRLMRRLCLRLRLRLPLTILKHRSTLYTLCCNI